MVNCRNRRLALCWPHLIKNVEYTELVLDFYAVLLGVWKMFNYSLKTGAVLESVQSIYGKKPLKMLKEAVTQWLTHGRVFEHRILD